MIFHRLLYKLLDNKESGSWEVVSQSLLVFASDRRERCNLFIFKTLMKLPLSCETCRWASRPWARGRTAQVESLKVERLRPFHSLAMTAYGNVFRNQSTWVLARPPHCWFMASQNAVFFFRFTFFINLSENARKKRCTNTREALLKSSRTVWNTLSSIYKIVSWFYRMSLLERDSTK